MSRIKIDFPETVVFSTQIAIRITDINYGGHLGNDALLSLMHEVRMRFLTHYGYSEKDMGGASVIMSDCAIVYKAEAYYGDVLRAEVSVSELNKYGFDVFYRFSDEKTGREVAVAKTGIVCFDYSSRKVALLPEKLAFLSPS